MVLCAGLPSSVRLASPQRCSPARNGRFARPCDRSTYTYTSSGRSPARLVSFSQVPPRWRRRSKPRSAPSGAGLTAHVLLPRAASSVRSAILRRRNTGSSSRSRPLAHHANRRLAVPLRTPLATACAAHFVRGIPLLTHAPLARPSAMARFSS